MQAFPCGLENRYDWDAPAFQTAFSFLSRTDLADLPEGWIDLDNGVRASIQHYTTMDENTLDFETHDQFFDIQYVIYGNEYIGVCARNGLQEKIPYQEQNDITFYSDPPFSGKVFLRAGDLTVLAPEDAHKPRCFAGSPEPVKKVVLKVPVRSVLR